MELGGSAFSSRERQPSLPPGEESLPLLVHPLDLHGLGWAPLLSPLLWVQVHSVILFPLELQEGIPHIDGQRGNYLHLRPVSAGGEALEALDAFLPEKNPIR